MIETQRRKGAKKIPCNPLSYKTIGVSSVRVDNQFWRKAKMGDKRITFAPLHLCVSYFFETLGFPACKAKFRVYSGIDS